MSALRQIHAREEGQSAIFMVLMLLVVFLFFAIALDAGVWYTDHRHAQNQAEAAALAAVLELPDADTTAARAKADQYLTENGASQTTTTSCPLSGAGSGIEFQDLTGDGKYDTATVCVRRATPAFFAKLAGIDSAYISAAATARTGPVDSTNVMPWAVVAPDPTCTEAAGRNCVYDANDDGDTSDPGDCNDAWTVCPFGLTEDRLYTFKEGTGGNTGIIAICGMGAADYRDCLSGGSVSGVYQVGQTLYVNVQGGTIANATHVGLQDRFPATAWDLPGAAACDVASTPEGTDTESPGWDPDGADLAREKFVNPTTNPDCVFRLVPIPIIDYLPPQGGGSVVILGFAVFGVAKWNSTAPQDLYIGTGSLECYEGPVNNVPPGSFPCGIVWGYIFSGVNPPDALLTQIGNSNNPFAPNLVALVD